MAAVYLSTARSSPLSLGAAKANIGHSEAASGMLGVVRAQQVLRGARTSGNAHLRVLNPLIGERLRGVSGGVLASGQEQALAVAGRSGVSSFGFSGTITHALLAACAGHRSLFVSTAQMQLSRVSFPWLPKLGSKGEDTDSRLAFYCTSWQVRQPAPLQPALARPSLLLALQRLVGSVARAMAAARRAQVRQAAAGGSQALMLARRVGLRCAAAGRFGVRRPIAARSPGLGRACAAGDAPGGPGDAAPAAAHGRGAVGERQRGRPCFVGLCPWVCVGACEGAATRAACVACGVCGCVGWPWVFRALRPRLLRSRVLANGLVSRRSWSGGVGSGRWRC